MDQAPCPQDFLGSRTAPAAQTESKPSRSTRTRFALLIVAAIMLPLFGMGLLTAQDQGQPEFRWPMMRGIPPALKGITSTFAESRQDRYHNGVDVAGKSDPIRPVAAGSFLFSRMTSDDPFQPIPGAGNLVFMDHGRGWWSGYYPLEAMGARRSGRVQANEIIGYAGNSGHSYGAHLHFFIIKNYGRNYINPLPLLPTATDENAPIIGQLAIITPNGTTLVSHSRRENIRLTRSYPIQITIIDPGLEERSRRGVHRLSWILNDEAKQTRVFNELAYTVDGWKLGGKFLFDEVFREGRYNLGELNFKNGENRLTVIAQDLQGNKTTRVFDINVKKMF